MKKSFPLIEQLQKAFELVAEPEIATKQKTYLRNQFSFLGIPKPVQQKIEIPIFKEYPLSSEEELIQILQILWCKEEREFRYSALGLARYYKKYRSENMLDIFEMMIRNGSWWDTVDDIAANLVGSCVKTNLSLLSSMDMWIEDPNLWIRRSALLFQLKWKDQTDHIRLFNYCEKVMREKNFFIRKAIGWVLREYSKTNPDAVKTFIRVNQDRLSLLSVKEGSKYI